MLCYDHYEFLVQVPLPTIRDAYQIRLLGVSAPLYLCLGSMKGTPRTPGAKRFFVPTCDETAVLWRFEKRLSRATNLFDVNALRSRCCKVLFSRFTTTPRCYLANVLQLHQGSWASQGWCKSLQELYWNSESLFFGKLLFSRCNLYMSCHYHTCPSCNVTNIDRTSPSHRFDVRQKIGVVFILTFGRNFRFFHHLRSCICVHRFRMV